ncbi:MAG: uroporphyrinogen decarboxylase family protein [Treponema sp.]|nr:uroporphyrinogen decarboxylase family protein [Treponema sp.]
MTSSERLYARLKGMSVDKIPNMNIAMGLVAKAAGVSYREYVLDYRNLVEGNLICAERFGFDSVSVISDPMREASSFGAVLTFPEEGVPFSDPPLLADGYDLKRLRVISPLESPRTLDRIKGVELLRQKVLSDYPVIGWVEGVLAETADLRGLNALMYDLADLTEDDNQDMLELMDLIFKFQCNFALEQIKAGADIIGVGNAVASIIGPSLYEQYGLKYDKALAKFIHDNGSKVKLHICGNITPILPLLKQAEPDILDIDWMVDFKKTVAEFADTGISICGNVDPVEVMLRGDATYVEKMVRECLSAETGNFLIAAGCEVPAATPEENLLLMDSLLYV